MKGSFVALVVCGTAAGLGGGTLGSLFGLNTKEWKVPVAPLNTLALPMCYYFHKLV